MNAQVTWPTYYVIPPSTGCDGTWAINTSSTLGSCGMTPYTYIYSPSGCGTSGASFSGDTLFIPLCAVPCNLTIVNASGQTCSCSTGSATGINESEIFKAKLYPTILKRAENITIEFSESTSTKAIQIFDNIGRSVENISTKERVLKHSFASYRAGIYYLSITSSNGWTELHKISIE